MQQQSWPPPYYDASSYISPMASHNQPSNLSQYNSTPTPLPIQPDPLPPHSHPEKLSPTQSYAFQGPMPVQPLRLGKHDVLDPKTNTPILAISRDAVHMPSFLSSKPLLTITKCSTVARVGTIRFHNMTTSDIELTINGQQTVLSSSGIMHRRWTFKPLTTKASQPWYWQRDKVYKRHLVLTDAKKNGNIIARMKRDTLSFESVGLSEETLDEIVMTAVALAEHARRRTKSGEVADVSGFLVDGGGTAYSSSGTSGGHHHGAYVGGGGFGFGGDGGGCSGGGGGGDGGGGGGGGGC